ncbi:glycoside hydrolase family 6 protein [Streptomyces antibioticus]|uniref:glycoside hydrolase family 6 protein n=1 Tax=Streptomyces antibioticus TaxID=1890 RepID=UPI00225B4E77|nr:glycoside hydrolase family 6 protein [Streptomyces antibioticus]MCX5167799.1 glycoside hydrolase family 6 protein [Streptomyces antibioticus]
MVVAASVVVAVASAAGTMTALGEDGADDRRTARHDAPRTDPSAAGSAGSPLPSPSATSATPSGSPSPSASPTPSATRKPRAAAAPARLHHHPESQVLDWVRDHPDDPRRAVVESRIASRPAAVWFADYAPGTLTSRVRAVTSGAAAQGRVPVLVAYAIPDRDCGGASEGGAPDLDAYAGWIDRFAAGLGSRETVVILEPDSIAQTDCLSADRRDARLAALARAGRVLRAANPKARVYYDAGHSHWNSPAHQAALLRQAGAASSAGIFSNVSNFRRTADEIVYDRQVLDLLGGPPGLGAVIDTSRNGNGAPADGEWCDPDGRTIGRAPTLDTGEPRIDGYLWVKLPGESDGCKGAAGEFSPSYAYELASSS